MTQQRPLFDPFFDGQATSRPGIPNGPPGTMQGTGNVVGSTRAAAWTPDPNAYHDPSTVTLHNSTPLSAMMPSGRSGVRGVIIPRSTMGGVPAGTNPHAMSNVEVNVDPHIPSASSTVRLGDVTEAVTARANEMAAQVTPEPYTLEDIRLRGSAVMHGIAAVTGRPSPLRHGQLNHGEDMTQSVHIPQGQQSPQQPAPQQYSPQFVQQGYQPQPMQQPVAQAQVYQPPQAYQPNYQPMPATWQPLTAPVAPPQQRRASPMAAFSQPQQRQPQQVAYDPPTHTHVQQRPRVHATFEMEGFGEHRADFSDIVRSGNMLVLVNEIGAPGSPFWPAYSENPPPLAMGVDGESMVYLVRASGIRFSHGGNEYCILIVDRSNNDQPG